MGYRNVQTNDIKLTIHNSSAHTLVVVSAKLTPGQSKTVPLRYVLENYQRALELAALVNSGAIQITYNNTTYSYTDVGPLTPEYLAGLATPSAKQYGQASATGLAVARPAIAHVPAGFQYFATDTFVLSISTGVAWKDATLA
jgi:hypothetical protein